MTGASKDVALCARNRIGNLLDDGAEERRALVSVRDQQRSAVERELGKVETKAAGSFISSTQVDALKMKVSRSRGESCSHAPGPKATVSTN